MTSHGRGLNKIFLLSKERLPWPKPCSKKTLLSYSFMPSTVQLHQVIHSFSNFIFKTWAFAFLSNGFMSSKRSTRASLRFEPLKWVEQELGEQKPKNTSGDEVKKTKWSCQVGPSSTVLALTLLGSHLPLALWLAVASCHCPWRSQSSFVP